MLKISTLVVCLLIGVVLTVMAKKQNTNCPASNIGQDLAIVGSRKTSYTSGQAVFLKCKRGQFLGSRRLRCQNGKWLGRMPRCIKPRVVKKTCSRLRRITNGRVMGGSHQNVNSFVRFRCFRGFILFGKNRLKCLANGKWDGRKPRCLIDVSCPPPNVPQNGSRYGSSFKNGRIVKFSCQQGFKLIGSGSRRCMSNKRWTGQQAQCKKINPLQELREIADNLRKNLVNKFSLVTSDSRARTGIASGASGLDFVFLLDSSASVGPTNFRRGIKFVETIIREYGVSRKPQGTRVAIVTFQSTPHIWRNLQTNVINNISESMKALGNLKFGGGGTDIAKALGKVYHSVMNEARAKTKKVLFLITDGHSNVGSNPHQIAGRLREKNFEIFTIGVTKNADEKELRSIATQPYRSHVYLLPDYDTLEKLKDMITGNDIDEWICGDAGDTALRERLKTPNRGISRGDAWPWQAVIYAENKFECGGTLIERKWVLTSSRCFNKRKIKDMSKYHVEASLGVYDRHHKGGTEQEINVVKIFQPKKYSKSSRDDLVLLKLEHEIKQTAFVHHICLDENPDSTLTWPTQYGVVSGWGSHKTSGRQPIPVHGILHQSVVKFVSDNECKQKTKFNLKGNVFCGSSQDKTVKECLGDTGGPVMAKTNDDTWVLVGVMKYNEGCSAAKYSVFTKVGHYSKWITETIKNNP